MSRATGIALVLFCLAALYWPLNSLSGPDLQFVGHELVWSSLWHAALVMPVLFFPWLTGIWVAHCTFIEKRQDIHWIILMGYLLSIPMSLLWIVVALMMPGGVLLIVPTAVLGGLVVQKQEAFLLFIKNNAWGCFSFLVFSLIFGTLFGVIKHGPTEELWARPHGDFAFYASAINSVFMASSFPVADLSLEGSTLYGFNLLFPAIGAALLTILPLDSFLFLGATGSSYFILSSVFCLFLVANKNDGLSFSSGSLPFSVVVVLLSVMGISLYPSWIVDSVPMIYSAALTICLWSIFFSKPNDELRFGGFSIVIVLIGTALTKVVSVVLFSPFSMLAVLGVFKNSSGAMKVGLGSVFVVVLGYFSFMFFEFGHAFFSSSSLRPLTLVYFECCRAALLGIVARDLSTILLVAFAFFGIGGITGCIFAISLLLGLVMPVLFSSLIGFTSLLMALHVWHRCREIKWGAILLFFALLPGLWRSMVGDPSALMNWLWVVGFLGAFSFLQSAVILSRPSQQISHYSLFLCGILLFVVLLNVASSRLGVSSGQWQPHSLYKALTPEVYDIWRKVSQVEAEDALIFVDQVGPEVSLVGGWNTYSMHGQKQIYVAQWFQSGFRSFEHPVIREKVRINFDVIDGRRWPVGVPTKLSYKQFFAVVGTGRKMKNEWQFRGGNRDFSIYEWVQGQ